METKTKIVYFDQYCPLCKHTSVSETEDPCNECLTYPVNIESHKPVNFEENK
jgi:predicted DCC family thiol-disulfide oxidoreductase YuxK